MTIPVNDKPPKSVLLALETNERTETEIYARLARRAKGKNAEVLQRLAEDERRHHDFWKSLTKEEVKPRRLFIWWTLFMAKVLGLTFALRLMERGEETAQANYARIVRAVPEAKRILKDEEDHEQELIGMLEEQRLTYIGSVVLGLNDALVELTGALAGFTLALNNSKVVAAAGLITGIAATLSMMASDYLSQKTDRTKKNPFISAVYTGAGYIVTVIILVAPYFIFHNLYASLSATLALAIIIIWAFTYFVAITRNERFWPKFLEMAAISLGVAIISYGIGYLAKILLHVSV